MEQRFDFGHLTQGKKSPALGEEPPWILAILTSSKEKKICLSLTLYLGSLLFSLTPQF